MKMPQEGLNVLNRRISDLQKHPDWNAFVTQYKTGNFYNADKTKDVQRRFCFDVFHKINNISMIGGYERFSAWVYDNDMNDNHLYTALKSLLPKI